MKCILTVYILMAPLTGVCFVTAVLHSLVASEHMSEVCDRDGISSQGVSAPPGPPYASHCLWTGLAFVSGYGLLFLWSQVQHGTEGQQCC